MIDASLVDGDTDNDGILSWPEFLKLANDRKSERNSNEDNGDL